MEEWAHIAAPISSQKHAHCVPVHPILFTRKALAHGVRAASESEAETPSFGDWSLAQGSVSGLVVGYRFERAAPDNGLA